MSTDWQHFAKEVLDNDFEALLSRLPGPIADVLRERSSEMPTEFVEFEDDNVIDS